MTTLAMKPIQYSRRQIALMVQVAMHFDPECCGQSDEFAAGSAEPTPAVLNLFGLSVEGGCYVWNPR